MKKELVSKINKYLANFGVSYIKMHNLHWNVIGKEFKSVHEFLEVIYDAYADCLDEVAELLKMNGEMPLASLKAYLEVSSIEELPEKDYPINDAIKILLADMKSLAAEAADIRKAADEEDAFDVVAMMEDHLANFSKNIWFVDSMLK